MSLPPGADDESQLQIAEETAHTLQPLAVPFKISYSDAVTGLHDIDNFDQGLIQRERINVNQALLLAEMCLVATGMEARPDMIDVPQATAADRSIQAPKMIDPQTMDPILKQILRSDENYSQRREQILIAMDTHFAHMIQTNILNQNDATYGQLEQIITGYYRILTALQSEQVPKGERMQKRRRNSDVSQDSPKRQTKLESDLFEIQGALAGFKKRFYPADEKIKGSKAGDLYGSTANPITQPEKLIIDRNFVRDIKRNIINGTSLYSSQYKEVAQALGWDIETEQQEVVTKAVTAIGDLLTAVVKGSAGTQGISHTQQSKSTVQLSVSDGASASSELPSSDKFPEEPLKQSSTEEVGLSLENPYINLTEDELRSEIFSILEFIHFAEKDINEQQPNGKVFSFEEQALPEVIKCVQVFRAYQQLLAKLAHSGEYNQEIYRPIINGLVNSITARGIIL